MWLLAIATMQSPKALSSSAPRLVRSRALENVESRAPRASARSTLSRGHEDGRDVWGDALNAASAGTSPMTPSSVAGASQLTPSSVAGASQLTPSSVAGASQLTPSSVAGASQWIARSIVTS